MHDSSAARPRAWLRRAVITLACLLVAYAALLIPDQGYQPPAGAGERPFVWNQNSFWNQLEQEFVTARKADPLTLSNQLNLLFAEAAKCLDELSSSSLPPRAPQFAALETNLFKIAALAGASPARVPEFAALVEDARAVTKKQSQAWDLKTVAAREQLYRILFGGRMALEIVILQLPENTTMVGPAAPEDCPQLPGTTGRGVTLRSGDILVSRGTAPTSSLIARGNDYPGNFSHVALLHVDERTGQATIIESLIERGVVTTPLSEFLDGPRLRLMALRLRPDLPALRADPLLPHRVASAALAAARRGHIPYDFAMDFRDHRALFCSEVVATAYEAAGVRLWMGMTHISSPTVTAWLSSLGVRHFETQEPSDLEYDPQLSVVAEWRSRTNLFQAHLDDAVTDSMLESAAPGAPLDYNIFMLPLVRVVKAWSAGLNAFGKCGRIPEGMSATTALRVARFQAEHRSRKAALASLAAEFQARNGYAPPYWQLAQLAKPESRARQTLRVP